MNNYYSIEAKTGCFYNFINKQQNKNNIKKVLLYNPLTGDGYFLTKTKEWNLIAKKIISKHKIRGGMDTLEKLESPDLHGKNRSMIAIGG